jgi:hypothetical protein
VSTAYTNSNRRGFIEEKIYNLDRDPEEIINEVLQMNPQYISDNEQTLISGYPNTYTWTKSMAERALLKTHGHVRVALVRPSIVISSAEEPTQGWTDTLAAAGGIFFGVSSVSNTVLCTTAYTARMETPQVVVCHSSSSHHNPCTIAAMREALNSYSKKFPYYRSFSHPWGFATGNS